jgi:dephospho-CoA kinase
MDAHVVFVALPLFRPEHREAFRFDEVWAVVADPEVALSRLLERRGFDEDDARARLSAQMSNAERESLADRVLWNNGSLDELFAQLDAALVDVGAQ